jgi:hypothetical protein
MSFKKVTLSLVLMLAVAAVAAPSFVHATGSDSTPLSAPEPNTAHWSAPSSHWWTAVTAPEPNAKLWSEPSAHWWVEAR